MKGSNHKEIHAEELTLKMFGFILKPSTWRKRPSIW